MAQNGGGPSYEMLRASTPGVDHAEDEQGAAPGATSTATSRSSQSRYDDPTTTDLGSSSTHQRPTSSSDAHISAAGSNNNNNNRDSMAILGSGRSTPAGGGLNDGGIYMPEETQRRFFGRAAAEDGFINRGSVVDSTLGGASTPGLRGSMARYDSDDGGSLMGLAPAAGALAGAGAGSSGYLRSSALGSPGEEDPYRDVPFSPATPGHPGTGSGVGAGDVATPFIGGEKSVDSMNGNQAANNAKRDRMLDSYAGKRGGSRRRLIILAAALAGVVVLALVIALPVVLTRKNGNPSNNTSQPGGGDGGGGGGGGGDGGGNGNGGGNGGGGEPPVSAPITGGDGSTVTTDKNTTFTYRNSFGGFWVQDPDDPFNMNAQAQSCVLFLLTSFNQVFFLKRPVFC